MGKSKYRISFILLLGLSLSLSVSTVLSDGYLSTRAEEVRGEEAIVKVANLNVRYGPDSKNYKIIVTLHKGDKVTVYDEKNGWYEIGFPSQGQVWIHGEYVDLLGNTGTVTTDNVTLRADARFRGLDIGSIDKGEKVRVVAKKGKWYRIEPPDSLRAYVYGEYVQRKGPEHRKAKAYFRGKVSELLDKTSWRKTPEGRHLLKLDKQLWLYKTGIDLHESTIEELKNARKDVIELKKETDQLQQELASKYLREEALVISKKASNVLKYIDAVIDFKRNYLLVETKYEEEIEKIRNPEKSSKVLSGYVDDVGRFIGRKTPYVLKKGTDIICFLKSREKAVGPAKKKVPVIDFSKYYYTNIVVTDYTLGRQKGSSKPIAIVNEIQVKKSQKWQKQNGE